MKVPLYKERTLESQLSIPSALWGRGAGKKAQDRQTD